MLKHHWFKKMRNEKSINLSDFFRRVLFSDLDLWKRLYIVFIMIEAYIYIYKILDSDLRVFLLKPMRILMICLVDDKIPSILF